MLDAHYLVWLVVFLALAFDYINGFHDTANAIATSVSTRAIEPKKAIMMTAALKFFWVQWLVPVLQRLSVVI